MPNWTDEQLRAIEARGGNILLSAAAGSGKTTVLVERVLRLIANDGADVSRMLVVTFTRAAASDMRSKLSRQLSERAAAGDERCREQLLKLDQPRLAETFIGLAETEMTHVKTLHAEAARLIEESLKRDGEPPADMMAVYEYEHGKEFEQLKAY